MQKLWIHLYVFHFVNVASVRTKFLLCIFPSCWPLSVSIIFEKRQLYKWEKIAERMQHGISGTKANICRLVGCLHQFSRVTASERYVLLRNFRVSFKMSFTFSAHNLVAQMKSLLLIRKRTCTALKISKWIHKILEIKYESCIQRVRKLREQRFTTGFWRENKVI